MIDLSQLDRAEEFIDAACKEAQRRGYRILPANTVNEFDKCCCPLGACAIVFAPDDVYGAADELLDDHGEFAAGFDTYCGYDDDSISGPEAMGRRFRARYVEGK